MWTKPRQRPGSDYLARNTLAGLLILQTLLILPLLLKLPLWLWLVWAGVGLWRTQVFRGRWAAPGGLAKTLLTLTCAAGLLLSYSGKAGTEAMVGLLVCAFVLKLLELKSARDAQLLVFIGFIICACQLLFSTSPLAAIYALACLTLLIASWRSLYLISHSSNRAKLSAGARLLAHSLPVMLLLFVLLPRLGPLWAVPSQQAATTGFSDSLSPGDLGQLVLNRAPAFRVEFEAQAPELKQLYWRGLVLDKFDGRSWTQRDKWSLTNPDQDRRYPASELTRYSVIMEPHGQAWLFSLMAPKSASAPSNRRAIRITADSLLYNPTPVTQRLRYSVSSLLNTTTPSAPQALKASEHIFYTQLPERANPQTQALALAWRSEGLTDEQIIARMLDDFSRRFIYSLQPPVLGQDSVDEFLFSTRKGFCEHFASSFAVLLRAAGIPARVVVGYQGGSWNPLENYLLVRQSDAHAWTEVWLEGEGWRQIDPTAAVAPNRIEQGLDDALNADDQQLVSSNWDRSELLYSLQQRWDAASFIWQRWVLNYDSKSQEGLLTRLLGGTESWRILLWLLGLGLVAAALLTWNMLRSHKAPALRPETRALQKLERKLEGLGYVRQRSEPLGKFIARVIQQQPQWHTSLNKIAQTFEQIAYQQQASQLAHLEQQIKRFPSP